MIFEPHSPWHFFVAGFAAVAAVGLLARYFPDRWRPLAKKNGVRAAVLCLAAAASGCLALAGLNPVLVRENPSGEIHLSVVFDVSDSVLNSENGWDRLFADTHQKLANGIGASDKKIVDSGTGSIVLVRSDISVEKKRVPMEDLPVAFRRITKINFPAGNGSNLEIGLAKAGEMIRDSGGRGAVLLISDGHQTDGDAFAASGCLAMHGIPVFVFPVKSRGAGLSIMAADLPRQVDGNSETFMRGLVMNGRKGGAKARIALHLNPGLEDAPDCYGAQKAAETGSLIAGGGWARIHRSLSFRGYGIQFADLVLDENGRELQRRRFFTYVHRPPRILAIGNNRWTDAMPRDSVDILRAVPEDVNSGFDFSAFDEIVVSGLAADAFSPAALVDMARAVKKNGVGLMLINGRHYGASEESPTVLMSYNDTPVEPLLPVSSLPRKFEEDQPPRQIVILIDASGSMSGWPLMKSKEIANHIVQHLLRPKDRLDLIAFTTKALHLVDDRQMDAAGKNEALGSIASIRASGGTDPSHALALLAHRRMENCGLIFISDGQFGRVAAQRPDCRATVFSIGGKITGPLEKIADPFPVGGSFDPAKISIPFFEPEPRKKYFEKGRFTALSMNRLLPRKDRLPVPDLPLEGSAVAYLKPEASMIAVRPKLTDPVLAFGKAGTGMAGVFASDFPERWMETGEGADAVYEWMTRTIPYTARDRYDFKLTDTGDAIDIRISLAAKNFKIPEIDHLSASIAVEGESPVGVPMKSDPDSPGVFAGRITVPRTGTARKAALILRETGADALTRTQRIPILIPPAAEVKSKVTLESCSFGMNEPLLRAVAETGGGMFDPADEPFFGKKPVETRGEPLWPFPATIAAFLYLAAVALQRWDP